MNVRLTLKKNSRKPQFVYCEIHDMQGELQTSATLDYCIDACNDRGYVITNAQEILTQIHKAGTNFKL